ncbi:MAG: hypothetical protein JO069_04390 [Verrucomicrobia bacterium]|nr:hypothetical protein [Verrucomicrobiota bacterium]
MEARVASTLDRDDPLNYVSFDDFVAGASRPWSTEALVDRWNQAHPENPVIAQGISAAPNTSPITPSESCTRTRIFAALQLVGGGLELIIGGGALLAPEPTGATKVVGAVVLLHGLDTAQASVRSIVSCDRRATFTQLGASAVAENLGAAPQTAQTIGVVTDIGVGIAGTFAVGSLTRVPAGASQLVHLTNADSAAAIRASETLGLGRSTIYAGPETLAQARGWRILARTGIMPSQATEAILLPGGANPSFLVVSRIGPFTAWQRLNGTVFSAGTGSFNLTTGAFTRTGPAMNQLVLFGVDSAVVASLRAPADVNATVDPSR